MSRLCPVLAALLCLAGCPKQSTESTAQLGLAASPCASWWGCGEWGLCTSSDGVCVAASDADCERSVLCRESGACSAAAGTCHPTAVDGRCDGLGTERMQWCKNSGYCTVVNGVCTVGAERDADCLKPQTDTHTESPCRSSGQCTARNGQCIPTRPDHCRLSTTCRDYGYCRLAGGRCSAEPNSCESSRSCADYAECTYAFGTCIATDASCGESTACIERQDGCTAKNGRCQFKQQPFIYFQF